MMGSLCLKICVGLISVGYCFCTLASKHECNRPCEEGKPMVCEYTFTIENYYVLSKACYSCPFNQTDCFRQDCVTTNGKKRNLMTVNRQMPGTSIEVCKGDTVVVRVENKMEDGMSTSIHWHGQFQVNSCPMDGVAMLTQCSIAPYEVFRYEFTADPAGTHWWHSHAGLQMAEGLTGAFIVREPLSKEPHGDLYDEDLSDHVIMINDWTDIDFMEIYEEENHDRFIADIGEKYGIGALVNGRAEKHLNKDKDGKEAYTPVETFNVEKGKRYRFRLIAGTVSCWFKVSVDNHKMNVIATDGEPVKPVSVDVIQIHPGERYDFVLTANQEAGNYWIKIQGLGNCDNNGHAYAILHYNGFEGDPRPKNDPEDFSTQNGTVLNPLPSSESSEDDIFPVDLRYGGEEQRYEDEEVDVQYHIEMIGKTNDNTRYNRPDLYNVHNLPGGRQHLTLTLNNITLFRPPVPLVTQWTDAADKLTFCNYNSMDTIDDCNDNLCYCTHMLDVELGQVVELFIFSDRRPSHPMHLHGQNFRVVGAGQIEDASASIEDIKAMDAAGKFPRVFKNALRKDTLMVDGGAYSIIRFKATNPGIWFLHCHVETHLMIGMAMLIKVGDPDEFPKPPSWSRKCGGYDYQPNESLKSSSQEGAPNSENSGVKSEHSGVKSEFSGVYIIVGAGMLIALLLGVIAVLIRKLYNRRAGYTILRT